MRYARYTPPASTDHTNFNARVTERRGFCIGLPQPLTAPGKDYIAGTVARVAATVERDVAAFECTRERERIVCRWAEGPAALAATVVQCVPLVAAVPPTGRPHEIPSGDAHQCKLMHT